MLMSLDRRRMIVGGAGALALTAFAPRIALAAAPTERRFVFIIQRGAADGLDLLPPLGDPAYAALRGPLARQLDGAARIDATFSLHPAMTRTAQLFAAGQALGVHAAASAYRDRSHFDGQNVLETGGRVAYAEKTGWMNRLIPLLPDGDRKALAVAADVPMALRGPAPTTSYAPLHMAAPNEDLLARVSQLYAADPQLHRLWQEALDARATAEGAAQAGRGGAATGRLAASFLAPAGGARLVMIETGGWDTHSGQAPRLARQLAELDALVDALADGLGPAWSQTLVLVATEFGRTAAVNGTQGTDHGTGSAMLLYGGALAGGGRVIADWPGLSPGALFEARDLKPTVATEAVIAGAVSRHFALDPGRTAAALYPAQPGLRPAFV